MARNVALIASERGNAGVAPTRILAGSEDIRAGIRALRRKCSIVRRMHDLTGDPPSRRREPGFAGLARIIVAQQVSVASAEAIWARLAGLVEPMTATGVAARSDDELRAAGLSRPKVRTLRAITSAVIHDALRFDAFEAVPDAEVRETLMAISGVGPWTADIFLMFCLGRSDAFAAGDLALQEAARLAFDLDHRPSGQELLVIAERWRPWRSVAALQLWSYYRHMKQRDGVTS